jgi:hypothetical protein
VIARFGDGVDIKRVHTHGSGNRQDFRLITETLGEFRYGRYDSPLA